MTTKKKKNPRHTPETNPQFWAMIEERRTLGELNERAVLDIIKSTDQPLSSKEIAAEFSRRRNDGVQRDVAYINKLLTSLVKSGEVCARTESMDERKIRANGHQPRGHVATLYMLKSNKQARRTQYEALTGIALKSEGYTGKQIGTYKRKKKNAARKAAKKQTDHSYVEQLEARVRELEAKLAAINALSS